MAWYKRLFNFARSDQLTRDLDREFAHHIAERRDELMNSGMNSRDADREARRKFGNATAQKERTRDVDVLTWLESCFADVRYAVRALGRSPAFALVAILSLALGIGANTAIFSLINAVMLKSLPVQHPEQLVAVTAADGNDAFTNPIWEQVRDHADMFSGIFGTTTARFDLTTGGEVRRGLGEYVSGDYFSVLGVAPEAGRLIAHSDDTRGCRAIAVISHAFWQSEFGGDPKAVGKSILLDSKPFEIVGIADPAFFGMNVGIATQIYAPLCAEAVISGNQQHLDQRARWWISVIGRLKPGVSDEVVRSRLKSIAPAVFQATVPEKWGAKDQANYLKSTFEIKPQPAGLSDLRDTYKPALYTLMVVVVVVLLIACGNVANLLLARARVRQREAAVRLAVGAGRGRLVRQLLTESLVIAAIGTAAGVLLARWGARVLVSLLSPSANSVWLDLDIDGRMLAFTSGIAVLTGLIFGIVPALRSASVDPQSAMRGAGRGITNERSRFSLVKALVIGQVALSLTLLVAAGLLLGSFSKLTSVDLGFRSAGVLVVNADVRRAGYSDAARPGAFQDILDRLRAIPGVQSVATTDVIPMGNMRWNELILVDGFVPKTEHDAVVWQNAVSPGYFSTMGIPMVAGRDFGEEDRAETQPVAVINESVAKKFFAGKNPVGQYYHTQEGDKANPPVLIVGVVKDSRYGSVSEDNSGTIFLHSSQAPNPGTQRAYVMRVTAARGAMMPPVKSALAAVNPSIAFTFNALDTIVAGSLTRSKLLARLSAFFGALALLLAIVGLYGTMAYTVERRRNEIGIRIALGAARTRVLAMVLGEAWWMVFGGIAVGIVIAVGATRWVSSLLYGLTPTDAGTYIIAAFTLAIVALGASAIPAWRAARLDPMDALREE